MNKLFFLLTLGSIGDSIINTTEIILIILALAIAERLTQSRRNKKR
ncbi:MAG: hypothetical protein ABI091_27010 [Ferruginibacter sp.]